METMLIIFIMSMVCFGMVQSNEQASNGASKPKAQKLASEWLSAFIKNKTSNSKLITSLLCDGKYTIEQLSKKAKAKFDDNTYQHDNGSWSLPKNIKAHCSWLKRQSNKLNGSINVYADDNGIMHCEAIDNEQASNELVSK